ncbi:hypothetical protein VNO80_26501 [Phaseolus coccineus]|uniref:Uncharacterized protein n=1 Tax=Phaseolus coccineus TaxID=3886 RepID=A0AAN9LEV7_PHACN
MFQLLCTYQPYDLQFIKERKMRRKRKREIFILSGCAKTYPLRWPTKIFGGDSCDDGREFAASSSVKI